MVKNPRSNAGVTNTHTPHTQQINFSLLLRCLGTKSRLTLWKAPWTIACQAPLSMGFPRRVAISFSRGSSWPRDQTWFSYISGGFFTVWATRDAPIYEELKVNLEALNTPDVQIHRAKNWGDKGCSPLCVNVLPTKYTCRGELFRRSLCLEGKKKSLWKFWKHGRHQRHLKSLQLGGREYRLPGETVTNKLLSVHS